MNRRELWSFLRASEHRMWRAIDTERVMQHIKESELPLCGLVDEINAEREALRRAIGEVAGEFNIQPTRKPPAQAGEPDEQQKTRAS